MYDLIVAALPGCLFYFQDTFAFLYYGTRINGTVRPFDRRYRLSCKRRLIDSCFTFQYDTIHRDDTTGTHNDCVSWLDLGNRNQYFSLLGTKPNPIYIERHTASQIFH